MGGHLNCRRVVLLILTLINLKVLLVKVFQGLLFLLEQFKFLGNVFVTLVVLFNAFLNIEQQGPGNVAAEEAFEAFVEEFKDDLQMGVDVFGDVEECGLVAVGQQLVDGHARGRRLVPGHKHALPTLFEQVRLVTLHRRQTRFCFSQACFFENEFAFKHFVNLERNLFAAGN